MVGSVCPVGALDDALGVGEERDFFGESGPEGTALDASELPDEEDALDRTGQDAKNAVTTSVSSRSAVSISVPESGSGNRIRGSSCPCAGYGSSELSYCLSSGGSSTVGFRSLPKTGPGQPAVTPAVATPATRRYDRLFIAPSCGQPAGK